MGKAEPTRFHAWEGGQLDGPGCVDWEQTRWNLCRRAGRSLVLGREDFYSEVSTFFFYNYFWQLNETGVISQNVLLGWTCFPLTWLWLSPPRGGAEVVTALCEQLRYLVTLSAPRRSHSSFSPPEVSLQEQFSCGGSWHQASLSWKLGGGNKVSFNLLLPCPHVPAGGCASSQVRMPHPKALLPSPCAIT